jgi:hypothetical protein
MQRSDEGNSSGSSGESPRGSSTARHQVIGAPSGTVDRRLDACMRLLTEACTRFLQDRLLNGCGEQLDDEPAGRRVRASLRGGGGPTLEGGLRLLAGPGDSRRRRLGGLRSVHPEGRTLLTREKAFTRRGDTSPLPAQTPRRMSPLSSGSARGGSDEKGERARRGVDVEHRAHPCDPGYKDSPVAPPSVRNGPNKRTPRWLPPPCGTDPIRGLPGGSPLGAERTQ